MQWVAAAAADDDDDAWRLLADSRLENGGRWSRLRAEEVGTWPDETDNRIPLYTPPQCYHR